jgi:hypothetical protein
MGSIEGVRLQNRMTILVISNCKSILAHAVGEAIGPQSKMSRAGLF